MTDTKKYVYKSPIRATQFNYKDAEEAGLHWPLTTEDTSDISYFLSSGSIIYDDDIKMYRYIYEDDEYNQRDTAINDGDWIIELPDFAITNGKCYAILSDKEFKGQFCHYGE